MNPWALAALGGLLHIFLFAPFSISPLAWVVFVPLILALRRSPDPGDRIRLTAFSGMIANTGQLYWLAHTVTAYTELPAAAGWGVVAAVSGLVTACWVIWVILSERLVSDYRLSPFLAFPSVWILTELIRMHAIRFPWNLLGYALVPAGLLRQSADLFGVLGLSGLVVWTNVVLASAVDEMIRDTPARQTRRQLILVAAALTFLLGYGFVRSGQMNRDVLNPSRGFRALLVQGNIPQSIRWDPGMTRPTVDKYLSLTREGFLPETQLVLWPESALPFPVNSHPEYRDELSRFAATLGIPLVTGGLFSEPLSSGLNRWFNSLYVFEPGDRLGPTGRYDKVELVPYGEYVPFSFLKPVLELFEPAATEGFTPGHSPSPLKAGGWKLAPLICYEALFPSHVRGLVNRGADILVNPTNDAWFGRTSAPEQLLLMSSLRAVETRRYLLRAANTGITAMVNPAGNLHDMTVLDTDSARTVTAGPPAGKSLYLWWGDGPVWLFLAMTGMLAWRNSRARLSGRARTG